MKGSVSNYENTFFLNQSALSGIISFDGSYTLSTIPINVIGKGYLKQVLAEVPTAEVSISRYLVNSDPILNLTGNGYDYLATQCSGGIVYGNRSFGFGTGYLNAFGIQCSVGSVPQINSSFSIYGNIGSQINTSGNVLAGGIFVPQVKNISVTCRGSTTNRVKELSLDFSCPKIPIYSLQQNDAEIPVEVHNKYPIEVTATFTLDVDDYETKKAFDILDSDSATDFSVRIGGAIFEDELLSTHDDVLITTHDDVEILILEKEGDSLSIFNFTTEDALIISERVSSSAEDFVGVKVTYKSYLN